MFRFLSVVVLTLSLFSCTQPTGATQAQLEKCRWMAEQLKIESAGIDNYAVIVLKETQKKTWPVGLGTYQIRAEALNEKVAVYADLWRKVREQDETLPDPKTFLRPTAAPDPKLLSSP